MELKNQTFNLAWAVISIYFLPIFFLVKVSQNHWIFYIYISTLLTYLFHNLWLFNRYLFHLPLQYVSHSPLNKLLIDEEIYDSVTHQQHYMIKSNILVLLRVSLNDQSGALASIIFAKITRLPWDLREIVLLKMCRRVHKFNSTQFKYIHVFACIRYFLSSAFCCIVCFSIRNSITSV